MIATAHRVCAAAVALALALVLNAASPAVAGTPSACHLLTKSLAEDYFNTDMTKTTGARDRCEWTSRVPDLHRSASLALTTWRKLSNAKQFFDLGCKPGGNNRPKKVTLPGADQACASAGYTGICFDKPTGSVCLWEVRVDFRRGNVTGEVGTVAPKGYSINSIPHTTRLARQALARWP